MSETRIWAVVPAAGVGARMASDRPKQYLELQGKTVIEHSLQKLLAHPGIFTIYVAIAEDDPYWPQLAISQHPRVVTVPGGQERADSVLNALQAMSAERAADDWVLVHDAARPCLHPTSLNHLLESLKHQEVGGILANPVHDTIKRVVDQQDIQQTLDRSVLWQAQTPQLFRYEILRNSLQAALAAGAQITDEASAIEWAGLCAKVVQGPNDNIKITRPEDLPLAEFILSQQL